jgi:hypothetical protein
LAPPAFKSEWKHGVWRDLVLESADDAILESRSRLCKEVLAETVMTGAWEVLEVKRIVKEATNGGLLEKAETELRMSREERECVRIIMMEEEAQSRKMEKIDRLKKAWLLKMNAMKYQRMVIMMEEMTVEDMAMDMEWIESKIMDMMDVKDQTDDWRIRMETMPEVGVKDTRWPSWRTWGQP